MYLLLLLLFLFKINQPTFLESIQIRLDWKPKSEPVGIVVASFFWQASCICSMQFLLCNQQCQSTEGKI